MSFFDDKIGDATEIKFFRKEDAESLVQIDRESGDHPWNAIGIQNFSENRGGIFVAWSKSEGRAIPSGYIMFRRLGTTSRIIDLVVRKAFRRHGIASRLVCKLARSVNLQEIKRIGCVVKEHDIGMQCLLRSLGFLATATLKFEAGDSYSFEFHLPQPAEIDGR